MAGRQVRFEEGPQAAYGLVLSLSSGQGDKREVVGLLFRGGGGGFIIRKVWRASGQSRVPVQRAWLLSPHRLLPASVPFSRMNLDGE